MTMYIKANDGEWTELGGVMDGSVKFIRDPEAEPMDDSRLHSLTGPYITEFEFNLSKWGYIDFMMLMLGISRKEARRLTGRKPLLKNGKAWR